MMVVLQNIKTNKTEHISVGSARMSYLFDSQSLEQLIDFKVNSITSECRKYKAFPLRS